MKKIAPNPFICVCRIDQSCMDSFSPWDLMANKNPFYGLNRSSVEELWSIQCSTFTPKRRKNSDFNGSPIARANLEVRTG